jgi:hypothetical protein
VHPGSASPSSRGRRGRLGRHPLRRIGVEENVEEGGRRRNLPRAVFRGLLPVFLGPRVHCPRALPEGLARPRSRAGVRLTELGPPRPNGCVLPSDRSHRSRPA